MKITRIVASVKVLPIYGCSDCGHKQTGDTIYFDVDAIEASAIQDKIDRMSPPSAGIPVGWASYGRGTYRCPQCIK